MTDLTQSYLCGAAKAPLLYDAIGNYFDRIADTEPRRFFRPLTTLQTDV